MGLLGAFQDPQFRKDVVRGLLDAGNRGAVAGLLGGPVDTAALAMGLLGYKNDAPVGGSEWIGQKMQNAGFVSPERNRLAEALASVAVPAAANRLAPTLFAAEQKAAQNLAAPNRMNAATRGQAGAVVWHGSPHKFDKFDSSKIGTGEGAQAYGHGLYLAEQPDVAKGYSLIGDGHPQAQHYINLFQGDREKAAAKFAQDVAEGAYGTKIKPEVINDIAQSIKGRGQVYKVDLPDDQIARMLDWDVALNRQPDSVKQALNPLIPQIRQAAKNDGDFLGGLLGKGIYETLGDGRASQKTAQMLREAGIPGIRYLDGGSRGAGKGSSNYVVFPGNEDLLRILERNGQALPTPN